MQLVTSILVAGLLLATCRHGPAGAETPNPETPNPETTRSAPQPPARITFEVGDKLKIAFYEPLNTDKNRWNAGKPQAPGPSFYLHTELSGEYTVEADWTISVPMLGGFVVANHRVDDVQANLIKAFEKVIDHPGYVTITIAERKPLYIVGPVKNPGVYKFAPDLTPLNLVALAGGLQNNTEDHWAVVEAVREAGKQSSSLERLRRVLAQYAVLNAEINGTPVEIPEQLVELVGREAAETLVKEEQAKRQPLIQAREARAKALQVAIDTAQNALKIDTGRLQPLDESIKARRARLASMQSLFEAGRMSQMVVTQAQVEVADAEDRRANVMANIAEDQQHLAVAKIEAAKFETETKAELDQQLASRQREIDDLTPATAAMAGVIRLLSPQAASDSPDELRFTIVRNGQLLPADITTVLRPGDVLRIETDRPVTARGAPSQGYKAFSQLDARLTAGKD